jgi:hypothetical protein
MKTSHISKHKHLTSKNKKKYEEQDRQLRNEKTNTSSSLPLALEDLNYCLDTLKVTEDTRQKINESFKQTITEQVITTFGKRIAVLRTIVDFCASNTNGTYAFSQSELYDFLTLATQGLSSEQKQGRLTDRVFMIYRDLMENYHTLNDSLRLNYPKIIVDVMSVISTGFDTNGKKIGVNSLDEYYRSRKQKASSEGTLAAAAVHINPTVRADRIIEQTQEELVEPLVQMTGRNKKDLGESLAKLDILDMKKLSDLCVNLNKIEKYSKLANSKEFRRELEKELHRRLTDNQVQSATTSIKRVGKYVESLLDGKFVPHDSHGINHTKHNLEYGYHVMGLIKHKSRGSK